MSVNLDRQTRAAIGHLERIAMYLELGADEQIRLAVAGHPKAQAFNGTNSKTTSSNPVLADIERRNATDNARLDARLVARTLGKILRDARTIETTLASYVPASNDARNRLDPTVYCRIHWALHLYEGHRRWKGDLCSLCYRYKEKNRVEPTPTEIDYHHRHGRWPHKPVDPKTGKAPR